MDKDIYTDIHDNEFMDDLLNHKEFIQYRLDSDGFKEKVHDKQSKSIKQSFTATDKIISPMRLQDKAFIERYLSSTSYQSFISNFMSPLTPYKQILVKWETGTGKTLSALITANNFIECYKNEKIAANTTNIVSIFIIGFTSKIFKSELMKYP